MFAGRIRSNNLKLPKISIVTPTLNQGTFIEKTILSVLEQRYPNLEYIIIDGGSIDNTIELIKKYEKHLTYWISEKDTGQSEALNKGFEKASGDVLGWINSDDWYEKNTFDIVSRTFSDPSISVMAGNCRMVFEGAPQKNFIDKPSSIDFQSLTQYQKSFFCPPQPSIFFTKKALSEAGKFDESLNYAMDLDLWLRISKKHRFHLVDELLSNYLIHKCSKSGSGSGFEKFLPEWKKVAEKYIAEASCCIK